MKILISPSKTMKKVKEPYINNHIFEVEKNTLYNQLKTLSLAAIKETFLTSDKLSTEVLHFYNAFVEDSPAIKTYTGAQFKALDYRNLDEKSKNYLDKHLYIMSGLYGLLKPKDAVAYYRLPMGINLNDLSLKSFWESPINTYLKDEDLILNLASDEYGDLINHPLTKTVVFYQSTNPLKRAASMEVKKLRGLFLKSMATNQVKNIKSIRHFKIDVYTYNESLSNELIIAFTKS